MSRDFSDVSNVDDNNALLVSSIQSLIMAYLHIFTNRTFFFADMSSVSLLFLVSNLQRAKKSQCTRRPIRPIIGF